LIGFSPLLPRPHLPLLKMKVLLIRKAPLRADKLHSKMAPLLIDREEDLP